MNIYEIEKQATPGPLRAEVVGTSCGHCWKIEPIGACLYVDGQRLPHEAGNLSSVTAKANAALLAHCRNHFMEALETLKLAEKVFKDMCGPEVYLATHRSWPLGQIREAIAKLENVNE